MQESIEILEERLRNTPATPDPRPRIDLLISVAFHRRNLERWDEMIAMATEARELSESIGYSAGIASGMGLQAFVYYIRSEYDTSLAHCMKALSLTENDPDTEGKIRGVLSLVHWSLGNFEEALKQSDRSRGLVHQSGDGISEAFAFTVRGGILHSLGEYEQALAAHNRSLELFRENDYTVGFARGLSGAGSALLALGRLAEARECHEQTLEIARTFHHHIGISRALTDLGELAALQGDDDRAIELHTEALRIRQAEGYRQSEVTSLLHLGPIHARHGRHALALELLNRALRIAEEIGVRPKLCQVQHSLANLYEETGNLPLALRHFKAYDRLNREMASGQSALRRKAFELEAQLEFARKDAEIHRLRNVELKHLLEELNLTQSQLVNSEKMAALGGLVAGVAHEINTPLGVIRSCSDTALRCAEKIAGASDGRSPAALEALELNTKLIGEATQRIETLVRRLKSFAGIDRSEYTCFDVRQELDDTVALMEPMLRERVTLKRLYTDVPRIYGYAAEMNQVFMHLLRNSCQAIEGSGEIALSTECDPRQLRVAVTDNGRGIPPEDIPHLFNPGFSSHERRVKASLSLFACLSIVRKHGGDIDVKSEPGIGSTFTVILPRTLENAEWRLPGIASATA
jgi:signal transduction histidine kinase